jgi:hypothetical protein
VIALCWLIAIALCLIFHWSNGLLAIIAVTLLEIALTVGKLRDGMTDLCRMLKDDEPDIEDAIKQMDEAVRRMEPNSEAACKGHTVHTVHVPPHDWMHLGTKES